MKKLLILFVLILITGCMFNKKQEEPLPEMETEEKPGSHTIGIYFSGVEATEDAIRQFEEQTGGRFVSSKPEYGYFVFSFEQKTEEEMEEIQNQINELDYVKKADKFDSEFKEPEKIETNDVEQDELDENWTLPEY